MELDFKELEDDKLFENEPEIYHMLKGTLQYPAEPKLIGAKLAGDIVFVCTTPLLNKDEPCSIYHVWEVVIKLSRYIPPDHPWQDSLVHAVDSLRQREGHIRGPNSALWESLPYLSICMRESWEDGSYINDGDLTQETADTMTEAQIKIWKNQISFAARLTGPSWAPLMIPTLWQIRGALEERPLKGAVQDCRVWIACEWLLHCADTIREFITEEVESDPACETGSLCGEDIPQFGIKRWEFWKKRLGEIAADAESLKLEGVTRGRISEAVKRMEAVEKVVTEGKE
ncbi:hypothetical protein F5B19DRAFT_489909 [Rostrohypoxylon terebratum]|nr:hypothetical protein F5B19DRAFT_489909 [Rostrohypoxylon terebratum]